MKDIPVIKIIVSSGLEKPYYIKSKGMSPNGCYMRLGTSTQPMSTALIDELYAKRIQTTLRNVPAPRQDLTFAQLKIYYEERGLELNKKFANSLELLTPDGRYNYIAYLLADENGVSIKVAKYAGTDKSIFEISDHFIKVVFPFSVSNENEIIVNGDNNGDNNGDENRVLLLLEKEPNLTAKKISEQTGFSTRKISRIIKSLRETGKIIRMGSARKGYWKVTK